MKRPSPSLPEAPSKYAMDNFSPVGLHVLVVDDDPLCLFILEKMLKSCSYKVTTCICAKHALDTLRDSEDDIDLVLSDVYMPDVDGFKLLEIIGLELDLPVIMMSANGDTSIVMKGITHGACDYLIKPVRMEELRNIWQHVVRKKELESPKLGSCSNTESTSSSELLENSKKRKEVSLMDQGLVEDASILKRARMNWTVNLHQRFVNAVNQLGVEKAVPKKLLDVMNVKGLTRENVASHLQKYRLYLKQLSGAKLARHPIALFQASAGGKSGGSMLIMPGGRSPWSEPSIEGLNLRTGITESSVCAKNLGPGMERSLTTLEASQEKQQRSANRAQALGALGFVDSCPVAAAPKSSFDLQPYLQVPQSHLRSSWSLPSSLGGFAHGGPQPLKLEDEMGARPHGVQGEGFVSHLLSSRSMPSSLGVFAHSGQPLKLENEMGARPRDAKVEGFVSYWNINPVGEGHGLGSYANLGGNPAFSEGTQAGRCVEILDDKNLSGEMSLCTPTTEMNREINMDALDSEQIPEQQLSVFDYLLDEEDLILE